MVGVESKGRAGFAVGEASGEMRLCVVSDLISARRCREGEEGRAAFEGERGEA